MSLENTIYLEKPIGIDSIKHTMGNSLLAYLDLKIHPYVKNNNISKIIVLGTEKFNENIKPSAKPGKLFNYIRPSLSSNNVEVKIHCFPGKDYVFHFASIYSSYFKIKNIETFVDYQLPSSNLCYRVINKFILEANIPPRNIAILGYVEAFEKLSDQKEWGGGKYVKWKKITINKKSGVLIGFKHTFWGEIAGRVVECLASMGFKTILYFGKLGSLSIEDTPNEFLATGSYSFLPNGESIKWDNIFSNINSSKVIEGKHITLPSTLQESKEWLSKAKKIYRFVDPEIGHMAKAANYNGVGFSYLHIISDNLHNHVYQQNLSNERLKAVMESRTVLTEEVMELIKKVINKNS